MEIRLAGTVKESVVDGPGVRYVVFTQGCSHKCPGCHNKETHDMCGGYSESLDNLIDDISINNKTDLVTISGGEPFMQPEQVYRLLEALKRMGKHTMCYTGFTVEQLMNDDNEYRRLMLSKIDILVDGPFVKSCRNLSLCFRGSTNQRILDMPRTLVTNSPVELSYDKKYCLADYMKIGNRLMPRVTVGMW